MLLLGIPDLTNKNQLVEAFFKLYKAIYSIDLLKIDSAIEHRLIYNSKIVDISKLSKLIEERLCGKQIQMSAAYVFTDGNLVF
jgi:hypothetical protein